MITKGSVCTFSNVTENTHLHNKFTWCFSWQWHTWASEFTLAASHNKCICFAFATLKPLTWVILSFSRYCLSQSFGIVISVTFDFVKGRCILILVILTWWIYNLKGSCSRTLSDLYTILYKCKIISPYFKLLFS